jgi:succinoglycan biosynthesis transport protein ExoP
MEYNPGSGGTNRGSIQPYGDFSFMDTVAFRASERLFTWEQAVRVVRKNRRFALLLAGSLTLGTVLGAFLLKNVYQPTARLEIDPLSSGIKTLHEIEDLSSNENQDYLETQAQILQSDALAVSVIRTLHLARNPEFVSKGDISKWGESSNAGAAATPGSPGEHYLQDQLSLANRSPLESIALQAFQKHLSVNPVRNSRLVEVSFTGHDPELARNITNTLVTQFIDQSYRTRYATTMEVSEWLSKQLNDLRERVKESNQAVTDYQKKYDLVETDDHDVPLAQLMNEVNRQLSEAQASRIELEAYVRMIDLGHTEALPALRDDQVYQQLMSNYVDVRAKLAEARTVYGDDNSNVKKLENQSTELSEQLEKEKNALAARLRDSFAASASREQMMLDSREKLKQQMGNASSHMVAYRLLKNEAFANAQLYNTLQGRLSEAGIYAGLKSGNIHVIDLAAELPNPSGPNRRAIIGAGILLSAVFALVMVFVRDTLDNKVRTPDDIQSRAGLISLAMLPSFVPKQQGLFRSPKPAATPSPVLFDRDPANPSLPKIISREGALVGADAMRDLRTALMFSRPGNPPHLILVTSASSGEGKTTVAMNLAAVLSRRSKTCLVECDLRQPQIAEAFGLTGKAGLSHVLVGAIPKERALVRIQELPGLSVLPAGAGVPNPGDLIASEQMQALTVALKNEFDFVIFDSPPVIPFSDARFLSTIADAVVLVARYEFTTHRAIERSAQLLNEVHAPLVGVVLNGIDLASPDYHYYNYGYSKSVNGYPRYTNTTPDEAISFEPPPEPPRKKSASAGL